MPIMGGSFRAIIDPEHKDKSRKAGYLWAVLLARIYKAFPLTCPHCAGEMRIIAFVTDPSSIQPILAHIGEPTRPPTPAADRDPPAWGSDIDGGGIMDPQGAPCMSGSRQLGGAMLRRKPLEFLSSRSPD